MLSELEVKLFILLF